MSATAAPTAGLVRTCYVCGVPDTRWISPCGRKLFVFFRPGFWAIVLCDGHLEVHQRHEGAWAYCPVPQGVRS